MTLEELCQPIINYICEINRIAHQGGKLELAVVRTTIKKHFERMYDKAVNDMEMTAELDKIRLPLVFFIDHIVKEGNFEFKDQWEEFGKQFNELSGDEKFFDLLDECLNDPSASATQRLKVFYQCMGVGFNGCYTDDPDYVERKMRVCGLRIGINSDTPMINKVTPSCYEHTQLHTRFLDPTKLVKKIFFITLLVLLVLYFANIITFYVITRPMHIALHNSLKSVTGEKASLLDNVFQVFTTDKHKDKDLEQKKQHLKIEPEPIVPVSATTLEQPTTQAAKPSTKTAAAEQAKKQQKPVKHTEPEKTGKQTGKTSKPGTPASGKEQ